jgi:transcriptional regulator GlxA family with amidase domain
MHRIVIVAYDGVQTLDVAGPAEVFAATNRQLGSRAYEVILTAMGGGAIGTSSGIPMTAVDLRHVRPRSADTVIIAGGEDERVAAVLRDATCLAWVRRVSRRVRRTASVCTGAFILAGAGVLDGRRATTHWSACERLAQYRPAVSVDRQAVFVRDGTVWTSAGVTTGIDMALAMVEEDHGTTVADGVARRLVLYLRRPGYQAQFSDALVAQAEHASPLGRVLDWARAHVKQADLAHLARHAGLSLRTFYRRCLAELGTTPAKLLDRVRVEHARTLLSTTPAALKAVAESSGFGSVARMKRAFVRELGMPPRDYRLFHPGASIIGSKTGCSTSSSEGLGRAPRVIRSSLSVTRRVGLTSQQSRWR